MLCVHDDEELLGIIESVRRPIDDELAAAIGADGIEAERNISYVAVLDGQLEIVIAVSNTEASCVHSDTMTELTPEELRQLEPQLDALVAGSILPR